MKILCSGLMLVSFAICAAAQISARAPDVTVLEKKWRTEVYNPALDRDPLAPNKERQQEEAAIKSAAEDNENRLRQGEPARPPLVRQPGTQTGKRKLQMSYVYELKVRNNGTKAILFINWDYVFFEPGTTEEVGRRRFMSRQSIKAGATRHIVVRSPTSPTGTLDASKAGKKPSEQYSEQVVIRNVGYADGSNWPVPRNRP